MSNKTKDYYKFEEDVILRVQDCVNMKSEHGTLLALDCVIKMFWKREEEFRRLKAEYNRALRQLHDLGGCFEGSEEFVEDVDDEIVERESDDE